MGCPCVSSITLALEAFEFHRRSEKRTRFPSVAGPLVEKKNKFSRLSSIFGSMDWRQSMKSIGGNRSNQIFSAGQHRSSDEKILTGVVLNKYNNRLFSFPSPKFGYRWHGHLSGMLIFTSERMNYAEALEALAVKCLA